MKSDSDDVPEDLTRQPKRDFSDIAATLPSEEAAMMEAEVSRQRQIDPEIWRESPLA